jgi:hypothetical protein
LNTNEGSGYNKISQSSTLQQLADEISIDIISEIPCYCDIQFSQKEFLTGLKYPDHPFTNKLHTLIDKLETNN